jgi:hypothetical protein
VKADVKRRRAPGAGRKEGSRTSDTARVLGRLRDPSFMAAAIAVDLVRPFGGHRTPLTDKEAARRAVEMWEEIFGIEKWREVCGPEVEPPSCDYVLNCLRTNRTAPTMKRRLRQPLSEERLRQMEFKQTVLLALLQKTPPLPENMKNAARKELLFLQDWMREHHPDFAVPVPALINL